MSAPARGPAATTALAATPAVLAPLFLLGTPPWVGVAASVVVGALPLAASWAVKHRVWPRLVSAGGIRGVVRMLWAGRG